MSEFQKCEQFLHEHGQDEVRHAGQCERLSLQAYDTDPMHPHPIPARPMFPVANSSHSYSSFPYSMDHLSVTDPDSRHPSHPAPFPCDPWRFSYAVCLHLAQAVMAHMG